jgi:hypothetical protein
MVKGKKSFRDRNRALTEMQLDVYCAIKNRSYIKRIDDHLKARKKSQIASIH